MMQGLNTDYPLPLPDEEIEKMLNVGIEAAKKAGKIILEKTGMEIQKTKANVKDLVTEADYECQKVIEETILSKYSDHEFLGEEEVEAGIEASKKSLLDKLESSSTSSFLWVVDPIDGTTNFTFSQSLSVVSIALCHKGNFVLGIIFHPYQDELFSAIRGKGSFLNGKKIQVAKHIEKLEQALVCMGSHPNPLCLAPVLRSIQHIVPKALGLRCLGSSALGLAWVACGRLTAFWEVDLNSWDTAAGVLLIHESGGKVTGLDGSNFFLTTRSVLATNRTLHQQFQELLAQCNCQTPDQK